MSTCPFHQNKVRAGLPPLTDRIAALPVDERGIPVPFFVAWIDGKPEFRAADQRKWIRCHSERLCWVCGQKLGRFVSFTIGPMCSITRTTAEPPAHLECADWSVRGCPFLSKPKMVRREGGLLIEASKENVAGNMIERNPGVTCIWTIAVTDAKPHGYTLFDDGRGRPLIEIGMPSEVSWWREGRPATREEVLESIRTGLPALEAACEQEPLAEQQDAARLELHEKTAIALQYIPAEEAQSRIIVP